MAEQATPRRRTAATQKKDAVTGRAIVWRGKSFTIPVPAQIPLDALEAMEDGKAIKALRGIFGEKQYASFREVAKVAADVDEFMQLVGEKLGES